MTEKLLLRHPDIAVVALDATESMLAQARSRLAPFGDRVDVVHGDLEADVVSTVGASFDAVFSTGTFHWVRDHSLSSRTEKNSSSSSGVIDEEAAEVTHLLSRRA